MANDTVLYLFGFVSSSRRDDADRDADVFFVDADDVAVAASVVRARDYEPPPEGSAASRQVEWVAPLAWRHFDVLRRLHERGPVVPLKFGGLCPDADDVRAMLRRVRDPVRALLNRFEGSDEWSLRVVADRDAVAASVRRARPDLIEREEETLRMSPGQAYFARKRLDALVDDLVADELAECRARVWARLADLKVDVVTSGDDEGAALVPRAAFDKFQTRLADVEAESAPLRLTCELRGPWPPFSFVDQLTFSF